MTILQHNFLCHRQIVHQPHRTSSNLCICGPGSPLRVMLPAVIHKSDRCTLSIWSRTILVKKKTWLQKPSVIVITEKWMGLYSADGDSKNKLRQRRNPTCLAMVKSTGLGMDHTVDLIQAYMLSKWTIPPINLTAVLWQFREPVRHSFTSVNKNTDVTTSTTAVRQFLGF